MYVVGLDPEVETKQRQQMAEAAATRELFRRERLARFRAIALGLGEQGLAEANAWRDMFAEALASATDEYERCRQLEEQVGREKTRANTLAARLAATPAIKSPATTLDLKHNEERLALEKNVEASKAEVVSMEKLARDTRTELESFTRKGK